MRASTDWAPPRRYALRQAVASTIEFPPAASPRINNNNNDRNNNNHRNNSKDRNNNNRNSMSPHSGQKRSADGAPTTVPHNKKAKGEASAAPPAGAAVQLPLDSALRSFLRVAALNSSELRDGERVLSDLARALAPLGLRVQVFGSWCTGLRIPSSDMDFVALSHDAVAVSGSTASRSPLQRLAEALGNEFLTSRERSRVFGAALRTVAANLRTSRQFHVSTLILHAKVPIVKARHVGSRMEVDISFHRDGLLSSQFLCEEMKEYPLARGLIMLVKALVAHWRLDEPSNGGLGSFPIAMMVLWFLRMEVTKRYPDSCGESCGICLVGFLRFYGEEFSYKTNAIDYPNSRLFAKPPSLDLYIANPLMPHKNCAAAATLFHSRVVPKFREAFKQLSGLLRYDVSMSTAENTILGLFGRSVEALGGTSAVQKMMRKNSMTPVTKEQNIWDLKTHFYVGDVTS